MKRLKNFIQTRDVSLRNVYEGPMCVIWQGQRTPDNSPVYYDGEISYEFTRSNRQEPQKPTVTVGIPLELIFGGNDLKRLKSYFLKMDDKTSTYTYNEDRKNKSMYDGEEIVNFQPKSDGSLRDPEVTHDPVFYSGEVSYRLDRTNKLCPGLPTVTVGIPFDELSYSARLPDEDRIRTAAADALLREFARFFEPLNDELYNRSRPVTENGHYYVYKPGGEVLKRNSAFFATLPAKDYRNGGGVNVYILPETELKPPRLCFCVRMQVQLPEGKLKKAMKMLCTDLPAAVNDFVANYDRERLERAIALSIKQSEIRREMRERSICAFIADGSILPRAGETSLPMEGALPFKAPDTVTDGEPDAVVLAGVRGLGIRRGVTVITGGGYSGKSTLLDAVAAGVYDHSEGDGRELVLTDDSAVEISAEDGRCVSNVNITPFIKWLPGGGDPAKFSTQRASGSTSQAANIIEAVDAGSKLLLIDEDRSATNFMIRDDKMKRLIEREPITPFTDRVRGLAERGVSTILVIGGSGEYLSVADRVYMMDDYIIKNVTGKARELSPEKPIVQNGEPVGFGKLERGIYGGFTSYPYTYGSEKLEYSETGFILIGREYIDTRVLHGLVTDAQANMLGFMLRQMMISSDSPEVDFDAKLDELYRLIDSEGVDAVYSSWFVGCPRFLDMPRRLELHMALDRMRYVRRGK